MDNLYQWVQQQPSQLLSDQRETDWSKDTSSASVASNATEASLAASTAPLDMSDFQLTDLAAPSTSSSSLTSPTPPFFSFPSHSYFMQAPYNTMAYGGSSWPAQSHVPLSNYSSLNGATTSTTSSTTSTAVSSPPSQQQHSPPAQSPIQTQQSKQPSLPSSQLQQALMIDPSLTTLNGGTRTTSNHQHYPNANYTAQPSTVQPQQTSSLAPQQFSYTHLLQPSLASYRPPPSYYQSQQHQQSPQGTLSPQALHSSSGSMMSTLIPSSFYAPSSSSLIPPSSQSHLPSQPAPQPSIPQQTHPRPQDPPPPPQKTPQELKNEFLIRLRPQLQTNAFTGAGAVNMLVEILTDYGITDVDAQVRLETLTKMRDGAGNHYFRAWSENTSAMTITREWLKAAQAADAESPLAETIMPLLHIIDRLPLTLETLKASKLGKIIIKLVKEPRSPAIKDMAANVERKWRSLINNNAESSKTTDEDSKSKNLKRKLNETSSRTAPPPKKPAVGNTASASRTAVVKKEPPATSKPTAKDAKSDSSFFSAPKPKPKLPSFKKAPSASTTATFSKAPPPSNVAQPSSANPFEEALKSMGRTAKRDSPAVATPPSTSETPPQVQTNGLSRKGVKKKSVTWAPPSMLEQIKFIERAVYDDDPVDGNHTTHSLKDLDRGEGAALHAQVFEETLDWYDPILIENPIVEDDRQPGSLSTEKTVQEKREQTALGALYMSPAHIPDSPAEPPHVISEEETDKSMVTMTSGPEVDAIFWNGPIMPVAQSVAELVGQLANGGGTDPSISGAHFNGQGLDLAAVGLDGSSTLAAVQALPQEQIQRLLQQLQQPLQESMFSQTGQEPSYTNNTSDQNAWGTTPNYQNFGQQPFQNHNQNQDASQWGARGRGRGRGRGVRGQGRGGDYGSRDSNRRPPCTFFQAGRCKYGDQCDFYHDMAYA